MAKEERKLERIEKNGSAKSSPTEPSMDQLTEQYLAHPDSLSLEECRRVYEHFLSQVEATSEEASILKGAIEAIDHDLACAKEGDPAYRITSQGTYRWLDTELKLVPVDQLTPDTNGRDLFRDMEGEDFEQLKGSIREIGIIEPIIVDPKLRVICGHQRLRAAQAIGLQRVPVLIRPVDREETRAILAIEENIRRRQLQPSEMARAVKKLMELKDRKNEVSQVAKEIGLSKSQTYRYRDLSHLIPEISTLLDGGKLTQETALQIAQLEEDIQRVLYEALGERISEQKVVEFKRANADLISQVERFTAEIKKREQREAELKAENSQLQDVVEIAELKAGSELTERKRLEEELVETRAEKYQEIQRRQALIDKLSRNVEPKVVPPPDYEVIKKELKELKAKGTQPPEAVMTELYGVFTGQVLPVGLEALKGKLPLAVRELFFPLMPKIKAWVACLEELIGAPPPQAEPKSDQQIRMQDSTKTGRRSDARKRDG